MANGFDALLECLLEDIALCGAQGAASNDFKRFVKNFYDKADDGSATSNRKALVDQRLFNKVWRWLIRHPDIFIGKDGSRKDISLGDFEASEAEAARSGDDDSRANVRLFASEERTWYCLTGHGIDTKRVPQMEFELLSIIAFNGKDGILQPDLVRASGQDKRSVPKRTDNLCQKGLITKDGAMGGHTRTTRLTLKKFVSKGTPVGEEGSEDILSKAVFMNGCLIYENFLDYLLDHFSKFNDIISLPQLHQSLGVVGKRWEVKALRRAISRLENLEIVNRIQARPKEGSERWYRCIKLLRHPAEEDRRLFSLWAKDGMHRRQPRISEMPDDLNDGEEAEDEGDTTMGDVTAIVEADVSQDAYKPPAWSPVYPVANFLYFSIDAAGFSGISSMYLGEAAMGRHWKRPMDTMLGKLTDMWSSSQPPHLRHLAIVRDTTITKDVKGVHYLYRTFGNFRLAVEQNETSWDVLESAATGTNRKDKKKSNRLDDPSIDEWGFSKPKRQPYETGALSVSACFLSKRLSKKDDFNAVLVPRWRSNAKRSFQDNSSPVQSLPSPAPKSAARRGRPPKRKVPDSGMEQPQPASPTVVAASVPQKPDLFRICKPTVGLSRYKEKREKEWLEKQERRTREVAARMAYNEAKETLGYISSGDEEDKNDYDSPIVENQSHPQNEPQSEPEFEIEPEIEPKPEPERPRRGRKRKQPASSPANATRGLSNQVQEPAIKTTSPNYRTRKLRKLDSEPDGSTGPTSQDIANTQQENATPKSPVIASLAGKRLPGTQVKTNVTRKDVELAVTEDRIKHFMEILKRRTKPGVYIDPPGSEKPQTRGHQKKALVAVFASDRLKELTSFMKLAAEQGPAIVYGPKIVMELWAERAALASLGHEDGSVNESPSVDAEVQSTRASKKRKKQLTAAERSFLGQSPTPFVLGGDRSGQREDGASKPSLQPTQVDEASATPTQEPTEKECSKSYQSPYPLADTPAGTENQTSSIEQQENGERCAMHPAGGKAKGVGSAAGRGVDTVPAPVPEKSTPDGQQTSGRKRTSTRNKVGISLAGRHGGVYHKRTKLTMHILDLADGLIPAYVLRKVFETLWPTYYGKADGGRPDHTTVKRSIEALVQTGKIREVRFAFKREGAAEMGHILMLPHMSPTSKEVLEMQQKMKDDKAYCPEKFQRFLKPAASSNPKPLVKDYEAAVNDPSVQTNEAMIFQRSERKRIEKQLIKQVREQKREAAKEGKRVRLDRIIDIGAELMRKRPMRHPKKNFKFVVETGESITNPMKMKNTTFDDMERKIAAEAALLAENENSDSENELSRRDQFDPIDPALMEPIYPTGKTNRTPGGRDVVDILSSDSDADSEDEHEALREAQIPKPPAVKPRRSGRRPSLRGPDHQVTDQPYNMWVDLPAPYKPKWVNLRDMPPLFHQNDGLHKLQQRASQAEYATQSLAEPVQEFYSNNGTFSTEFGPNQDLVWSFIAEKLQSDWEDTFPWDLEDLLAMAPPPNNSSKAKRTVDPKFDEFVQKVDKVHAWEKEQIEFRKQDMRDWKLRDPRFINFLCPFPMSRPPVATPQPEQASSFTPQPQRMQSPHPPPTYYSVFEEAPPPPAVAQVYPRRRRGEAQLPISEMLTAPRKAPNQHRKKPMPRKAKWVGPSSSEMQMSAEDTRIMIYVIIICRTLAGGSKGLVPWPLVCELLRDYPNLDQQTLKNRWTWVKNHFGSVIDKLTQTFQEAFLKAYEKGEMPALDYNNLEEYDWAYVLNWALKGLPMDEEAFELPQSRDDFDNMYEIRGRWREAGNSRDKIHKAEMLEVFRKKEITNLVFSAPLEPAILEEDTDETSKKRDADITLAKSWIRANNATPTDQYDNVAAHAKLEPLGEELLAAATDELAKNRIFKEKVARKIVPGRNWEFSKNFVAAFEKTLNPNTFSEATAFKRQLDEFFVDSSDVEGMELSNGAISSPDFVVPVDLSASMAMVIINLLTTGQIILRPNLPPVDHEFGKPFPRLSRWGTMELSWKGRRTDRERLDDSVSVLRTRAYRPGVADALPPPPLEYSPSKEAGARRGASLHSNALRRVKDKTLLPLWSTIHKKLLPLWWKRFLATVLHVLATRTGVDTRGIVVAMRGYVEEWEVNIGLEWLVKVGVVEKVTIPTKSEGDQRVMVEGKGWMLKDGWWALMG